MAEETRYESSHTGQQIDDAISWVRENKDDVLKTDDIVNGLTSSATNKPLSAKQGKTLKDALEGIDERVGEIEENGSGGGMLVERTEDDDHVKFNFIDNSPALAVSVNSLVMGGTTKTATFKVSGQRLRGNINIGVVGTNFSLSHSQLSPTDGVVAETTITLTYSGTATASTTITISSTGATSKTITANYTEQQVPTIDVSTDTINFKAGVGGSQFQQLLVKGYNLEGAISLAFTTDVGGRFTLSQNSFSPSNESVNAQVAITYTPQSGDTGTFSATLRLTSTNATSVDVPLVGKVAGTMSISPSTKTIGIASGGSGTATFAITGENLTEGATISVGVSGTGFFLGASGSATTDSIIVPASGSVNESIVVRFEGSTDGNATLSVSNTTDELTASASVSGVISTPLPVGYYFDKDKVRYTILQGQTSVSAKKIDITTTAGAIEIPSSVSDLGLEATDGTNTATGSGTTYTVTTIPNSGFNGCTWITSFVMPNTITSIGNYALQNCSACASLTISTGLTLLSGSVFSNMNALTSVVVPSGVTTIEEYAFYGANNIATLDIYGAPLVKSSNFTQNTKLTKIIIRGGSSGHIASAQATSFATKGKSNGESSATLYVPDALISEYMAAPYIGTASNGYCAFPNENQIKGISELS